ncbi:hypothetical protein, partial [Sphingopyxis sp.]|uniref:hypothetical protein n=1 Tax=Sphingopyxis sp. TaxID=1908224 RepID=UPI0035B25E55
QLDLERKELRKLLKLAGEREQLASLSAARTEDMFREAQSVGLLPPGQAGYGLTASISCIIRYSSTTSGFASRRPKPEARTFRCSCMSFCDAGWATAGRRLLTRAAVHRVT